MDKCSAVAQHSRIHLLLTGRVQNVGFRSFVQRGAVSLSITGWVRNVDLINLEVMAEGSTTSLDEFINILKLGPRGSRVDKLSLSWENYSGEFSGFSIRTSR